MSTMNDSRTSVLNQVPSAHDPGVVETAAEVLGAERSEIRAKIQRTKATLASIEYGQIDAQGNPIDPATERARVQRVIDQLERDLAANNADLEAAIAAEDNLEAQGY